MKINLVHIDPTLAGTIEKTLPDEYNSDEYFAFPGFCDVHVHFREPGFSYKETIATGTKSALEGGFTDVCTMPNLNPAPDSYDHLKPQLELIKATAAVTVHPYGTITAGESGKALSDMPALAPYVCAFSDDGRGVQDEKIMREAMSAARELDKIIAAHCEDNSLLHGGYIHDGDYARTHSHRGICSESEWKPIERDLKLADETGCAYHVCHISTKESVELIRQAKKSGVNVTCETGPHYLMLDDSNLEEDGRFKMNPPLRAKEDRLALLEGIADGTVDMIATDHAPHSAAEKSKGLEKSAFGVVGLETSFPASYTALVKSGIISLEKLIDLMAVTPRKRFGIKPQGYTVWKLSETFTVNPDEFYTMGRATPFTGMTLTARHVLTSL